MESHNIRTAPPPTQVHVCPPLLPRHHIPWLVAQWFASSSCRVDLELRIRFRKGSKEPIWQTQTEVERNQRLKGFHLLVFMAFIQRKNMLSWCYFVLQSLQLSCSTSASLAYLGRDKDQQNILVGPNMRFLHLPFAVSGNDCKIVNPRTISNPKT